MAATERKIAILLIHGIGDQKPMASLRGFTSAILDRISPEGEKTDFWSKPDDASGSYELRRLNASPGNRRPPMDFYEFYWAHLMQGNGLRHTLEWLNNLLFRLPASVPGNLRNLWWASWAVLLALVLAAMFFGQKSAAGTIGTILGAGVVVGKLVTTTALRDWVGDAARYLNPKPHNVAVRHAIRKAGVDLLANLHDSHDYHRVIVVGHSLGSVIALDILYHYWIRVREEHGRDDSVTQPALKALEKALRNGDPLSVEDIHVHQKAIWRELRKLGFKWRVTDLVTLGSPLTHLPFLTGLSGAEFSDRLLQRELPKSPPVLDGGRLSYWVRYQGSEGRQRSLAMPHHAALFAATRWTNIYFPHDGWIGGDPVGGPLAGLFGPGVKDIAVRTAHWGGRLNHVDYWRADRRDGDRVDAPLTVLTDALSLSEGFRRMSRPPAPPDDAPAP